MEKEKFKHNTYFRALYRQPGKTGKKYPWVKVFGIMKDDGYDNIHLVGVNLPDEIRDGEDTEGESCGFPTRLETSIDFTDSREDQEFFLKKKGIKDIVIINDSRMKAVIDAYKNPLVRLKNGSTKYGASYIKPNRWDYLPNRYKVAKVQRVLRVGCGEVTVSLDDAKNFLKVLKMLDKLPEELKVSFNYVVSEMKDADVMPEELSVKNIETLIKWAESIEKSSK
jgi:hypothetical protein